MLVTASKKPLGTDWRQTRGAVGPVTEFRKHFFGKVAAHDSRTTNYARLRNNNCDKGCARTQNFAGQNSAGDGFFARFRPRSRICPLASAPLRVAPLRYAH